MVFQEIHDLDSFGHTITPDEEDFSTFDVPLLTNDQVDEAFHSSNNQVSEAILKLSVSSGTL